MSSEEIKIKLLQDLVETLYAIRNDIINQTIYNKRTNETLEVLLAHFLDQEEIVPES